MINLCHRLEAIAQRDHSAVDVANEFWRAALADRGLEFPSGAIRSVFELRLDDKGDRRLCVMDVDASSGVGANPLVIERSGKRFELSTDRELIKTLTVVDEQKKPALPELVPVLSIVLEMSALSTNTRENGLPWFVNETLVRTTFARDRSVYTFDWPTPVMDTAQFARLRTEWARWLEHPYIAAALRDEKLSVLELYVMVLGFVCEGDKRGWKDLRSTLPTTMPRAESLPLIHAARDAAWQRVTEIEGSSEPLDAFGRWVIEFVPRLATASAWDTATSDRGAGVVRTIARSKRRQSVAQRFEPTWFTRSGAEWLETSSFLLDDNWETTVEVVTKEGYKFFEKSVLLSPEVCAPIESMTIDQYLSLESRKELRRRIEVELEDRALVMKLESLEQRPGIHSLLTQIALIGAKLGERIDPTIPSLPENYSAVSDSYSLEVLWSGSYVFSEVPSYLAIEERDPFAAFVADLWIDTALVLPADSNESLAGANLWLATRPVWIAPVFGSPFDQQLLAEGWNQVIRAERNRSERVLAGWLSVCDETYRSRTIDDANRLPLSFDVPTAFDRSSSTLSIRNRSGPLLIGSSEWRKKAA